jgi:ATP/maltotriose-dependent transcriptional regulator MalT
MALVLNATYADGLRVADDLIVDAEKHRLDLTLPSALTARALALAGLKRFDEAHAALDEAGARARRSTDAYALQNAYAARMRILAQERRVGEAIAIEPPSLAEALPTMRGEVAASRGLALACVGRFSDAQEHAATAATVTRGLEALTLSDAVACLVAVESGDSEAPRHATALVDNAFQRGTVDILVTTYRASSAVLTLLLQLPGTREQVLFAIGRSGDEKLAEAQGYRMASLLDPAESLSSREREVCALVAAGLSNQEIAKLLFISDATVKAHLHRVFDKLGVRSRQALMARAVRDKPYQATLMTTAEGASESSAE